MKFVTNIAKVQEVSNICKVSSNERVDGVEGDGEEGDGEGETELDVLAGRGSDAQELVGASWLMILVGGGSLMDIWVREVFWRCLHDIADAAR